MKRQKQYAYTREEYELLSNQLDNDEMFVLSYLKGFDRNKMKLWQKKGYFN